MYLFHKQSVGYSGILFCGAVLRMSGAKEIEVSIHQLPELLRIHGTVHPLDGQVCHMEPFHLVAGILRSLPVVKGHHKPVFHVLRYQLIKRIFALDLLTIGLVNDMYAESGNDDCKYDA